MPYKVVAENAAIVGIAVIATGVSVAAACSGGGCGGGDYRGPSYIASPTDYDCLGGSGDGPLYVQGPFVLSGPDTYGLDADFDGVACEPFDDRGA